MSEGFDLGTLSSMEVVPETAAEVVLRKKRTAAQHARRVAIFVVGMAVVLAGAAMLVLPGPGLLVIIAGLSILAVEFAWARALRDRAKDRAAVVASKARRGFAKATKR